MVVMAFLLLYRSILPAMAKFASTPSLHFQGFGKYQHGFESGQARRADRPVEEKESTNSHSLLETLP
jgi:hypothetical protein